MKTNAIKGLKFWDDFDIRKSQFKDLGKVGKAVKGIGFVAAVWEVGENLNETFFEDKKSSFGQKMGNFAAEEGVDLAAGATAASLGGAIGGAIGTLIPLPGVGTAVGIAAGAYIGNALSNTGLDFLGGKSITGWAKSGLKALWN